MIDVKLKKEEETKNCSKPHEKFILGFLEAFAIADKIQEPDLDTPDLESFKREEITDNECWIAAVTAGQTRTSFSHDTDDALFRVSTVDWLSLW